MQTLKLVSNFTELQKTISIEPVNRRIKIYQLPQAEELNEFMYYIRELGFQKECDKLIFYVKKPELAYLDSRFAYEGCIKGFFNGVDAHIYSLFLDPDRNDVVETEKERFVMELVRETKEWNEDTPLPKGYRMRWANEYDCEQMAELYDRVFASYPTPMNDPDFILTMMNSQVYFSVIERDGQIVSACSSDIMPDFNAAELTDCATLKEHRDKGLLSYQVFELERRMKRMKIHTMFSYSRSVSAGMNLVNARHGYVYGGRMISNSNISGSLENMNIWYKNLI
ncbi:putative beta-lysine N-acetyltransferase [Bacillus tianshenii]|nr:putative beta-lysine N-acetyltransferase [Bacillus tianshenii]